ncbi:hypothetical protein HBI70_165630 [Parastagonospora nodorum]|nr:hypothetical protein HBH95_142850 [Parastagonospora nodorum]KAH5260587.1 hypothetical protein HBI70_165630 [Parastagonospora nodorum]
MARGKKKTRPDEQAVYNARMAAFFDPEDDYPDLKTLKEDIVAQLDLAAKQRREDSNGDLFSWQRAGVARTGGNNRKEIRVRAFATYLLNTTKTTTLRSFQQAPMVANRIASAAHDSLSVHSVPTAQGHSAPELSREASTIAEPRAQAPAPRAQVPAPRVLVPATPVIHRTQARQAGGSVLRTRPISAVNHEGPSQAASRSTGFAGSISYSEIQPRMLTRSKAKQDTGSRATVVGATVTATTTQSTTSSASRNNGRQMPPPRTTAASAYGVSRRHREATRETQDSLLPNALKRTIDAVDRPALKRPATARTVDIHRPPKPKPFNTETSLVEPRTPRRKAATPYPGRPTKSGNHVNRSDARQGKPSSGRIEVQDSEDYGDIGSLDDDDIEQMTKELLIYEDLGDEGSSEYEDAETRATTSDPSSQGDVRIYGHASLVESGSDPVSEHPYCSPMVQPVLVLAVFFALYESIVKQTEPWISMKKDLR